ISPRPLAAARNPRRSDGDTSRFVAPRPPSQRARAPNGCPPDIPGRGRCCSGGVAQPLAIEFQAALTGVRYGRRGSCGRMCRQLCDTSLLIPLHSLSDPLKRVGGLYAATLYRPPICQQRVNPTLSLVAFCVSFERPFCE